MPGGKTIRHVAISPDGRTAVVAGDDNPVRLFDLTTGAGRVLVTYKQSASCLTFSSACSATGSPERQTSSIGSRARWAIRTPGTWLTAS